MRVCVVGAGVVGCATAFELTLAGHQVTLIDAASEPGTGTSFANGAQLSYSYVEPFANPATLRSLPKLLLGRDSPVRFQLRADLNQWWWGAKFLLACARDTANAGTRQLLNLGALSSKTLDGWIERERLDFAFQRNGKLVLCADSATLERQVAQVRVQAHTGVDQRVLGRDECVAHEPSLAAYPGFVGGIWTPSECVGDPYLFCKALVALLNQRGARCLFSTWVAGFEICRERAVAVRTQAGLIEADAFVLATGLEGPRLASELSERLPIYPIKGYSLTLRMKEKNRAPTVSVTDLAQKTVFAPLNGSLRVAAMAEIVGRDFTIPPDRIDRMVRAVEKIYPGLCNFDELCPWAGLRPATPNSVPIIRTARAIRNVVLNVGHGALGFTLAAGSARLVSAMLGDIGSLLGNDSEDEPSDTEFVNGRLACRDGRTLDAHAGRVLRHGSSE